MKRAQRRQVSDSGASALEYGALLAVVAVLISALLSAMLPVFSTETKIKICQVFQGGACTSAVHAPGNATVNGRPVDANGRPLGPDGRPLDPGSRPVGPDGRPVDANGRPLGPDGRPLDSEGRPLGPDGRPLGPDGRPLDANGRPVDANQQPAGPDGQPAAHRSPLTKWGPGWQQNYAGIVNPWDQFWAPIHDATQGFFDGLQRGAKEVAQGLLGGIWGDVKGMWDVVAHPIQTVKGLWWAVTNPAESIPSLVWDDESQKDWKTGHKVRAVTRAVWNGASWFIPYYDIGKAVSKIGKFGKAAKAAEAAAKAGKAGRLAQEAQQAATRAQKAAEAGDVEGVRRAAAEARQKADQASQEAKRSGCKIGSLAPRGRRASARTPMVASTAVMPFALRLGAALGNPTPTPCQTAQGTQQHVSDALRQAGMKLVERLRNAGPGAHAVQRHLDPSDDKIKWRLGGVLRGLPG
ncbi:hypothetical protein ACSNOI_40945, partial [Actinomadura kijaniata]